MFGQNLESLPPLPKDHSKSTQDLVKNSTLNPGTGGVQMKKLFLGSVALVALGLGAPAFAADRPVPYTPPPPPAPVYTWTGCYVGANAGNSSGRSEHTTTGNSLLTTQPGGIPTLAPFPAGSSIAGDLNLSGFIGGFEGGCNYQVGAWVFGVEVDGS